MFSRISNQQEICCNKQVNAHNCYTNDTKEDGHFLSMIILKLYHQNLCGVKCKVNELTCFLSQKLPHRICISGNQLNCIETDNIYISNYKLCATHCKKKIFKGGCIFILNNIKFSAINLDTFCMDKDNGMCAIKLQLTNINI
jgi:hypothetical protein